MQASEVWRKQIGLVMAMIWKREVCATVGLAGISGRVVLQDNVTVGGEINEVNSCRALRIPEPKP